MRSKRLLIILIFNLKYSLRFLIIKQYRLIVLTDKWKFVSRGFRRIVRK